MSDTIVGLDIMLAPVARSYSFVKVYNCLKCYSLSATVCLHTRTILARIINNLCCRRAAAIFFISASLTIYYCYEFCYGYERILPVPIVHCLVYIAVFPVDIFSYINRVCAN